MLVKQCWKCLLHWLLLRLILFKDGLNWKYWSKHWMFAAIDSNSVLWFVSFHSPQHDILHIRGEYCEKNATIPAIIGWPLKNIPKCFHTLVTSAKQAGLFYMFLWKTDIKKGSVRIFTHDHYQLYFWPRKGKLQNWIIFKMNITIISSYPPFAKILQTF